MRGRVVNETRGGDEGEKRMERGDEDGGMKEIGKKNERERNKKGEFGKR